jgi:hypothetical protein
MSTASLKKFAAERTVRRLKGVKAVAQELEVRLPNDRKTADEEIAARGQDSQLGCVGSR